MQSAKVERRAFLSFMAGFDEVLDLKPYSPMRKVEQFKVPQWYENTIAKIKAKGFNITDF